MKTGKALFGLLLLSIIACSKEPPQGAPIHPNEKISELQMKFISATPVDTITYRYYDIDGTGGEDSIVTTSVLKSNTDYTILLDYYADGDSVPVWMNQELISEGTQHQAFFVAQDTTLEMDFDYGDSDASGNPLGLNFIGYTHSPSSGKVKVVLLHQPKKGDPMVQSGDILNAQGTTDFEAYFDISIQ